MIRTFLKIDLKIQLRREDMTYLFKRKCKSEFEFYIEVLFEMFYKIIDSVHSSESLL